MDAKQESEKKIGERFMLQTLSLLAHRDQLGNSCVPRGLHSFPQALPTGSQRLAELTAMPTGVDARTGRRSRWEGELSMKKEAAA